MKKARIARPPTYKKPPIKKNLALPCELAALIERHLRTQADPQETFTGFCQRALKMLIDLERPQVKNS
jgi:hypothetical protein